MSTLHVNDLLSAYLDNAVQPSQRAQIEEHLQLCVDCRRVYHELAGMVGWMKNVPKPEARAGIESRMMSRLNARSPKQNVHWKSWSAGFATAAVVSLAFIVYLDRNKVKETQTSIPVEYSTPETPAPAAPLVINDEMSLAKAKSFVVAEAPKETAANEVRMASAPEFKKDNYVMRRGNALSSSAGVSAQLDSRQEKVGPLEAKGFTSGISKPEQLVIRNQTDLNALLERVGSPVVLAPVDFENQMVVAAFMGSKPSAGYEITIMPERFETTAEGRSMIVPIRRSAPRADMMSAMMMTQPFHIKVVPAFSGPVRFLDEN